MPADLPTVRDIMLTRYTSFKPDTPVSDAIDAIIQQRLMGAPVVLNGRLVGVFSEKDAFRLVAASRAQLHQRAPGGTVADHMVTELLTTSPDVDLASLASHFLQHAHRGLPVVDEHSRLVGLVSRADALEALVKLEEEPVSSRYPDYRRPVV